MKKIAISIFLVIMLVSISFISCADGNGPDDGEGLDDVMDNLYYKQMYYHATLMRIAVILFGCTIVGIPAAIQQFIQFRLFMYFCYCEAFDKADLDGDGDTPPFWYLDKEHKPKDMIKGLKENFTAEYYDEFTLFLETEFKYSEWARNGGLSEFFQQILDGFRDVMGGGLVF